MTLVHIPECKGCKAGGHPEWHASQSEDHIFMDGGSLDLMFIQRKTTDSTFEGFESLAQEI